MNIIAAFLLLGFLVFIHELGHFFAGVSMRVPVEVFSIGFGPTIFKKTIRGVIFQIAILPFGGYCKFKGENPGEITDTNTKDDFLNISPLKKIFIYFTGPFFNYLLAVVIFFILALMPTKEIIYQPQIDVYKNIGSSSTTETTLAYRSGFLPGDTIISIDGKNISSDRDIMIALSDVNTITQKDNVLFTVLRNGENIELSMPSSEVLTSLNSMDNSLGMTFGTTVIFDSIVAGSPAEEVGLMEGDEVLAVDGIAIGYTSEFRNYIMERPNTKVELTILRNGNEIQRDIFVGENGGIGVIGVVFKTTPMSEETISGLPIGSALGSAFIETKDYLTSYISSLSLLFTGKIPIRDSLAGPVRIIQVTSEVAKSSFYSFLQLGAILSLILFFMNLLPLPVVDGGMIIVNLIELIFRKKISIEVLSKIQMVGAVLLITLAIFITANDITFLFK